MASLFDMLLGGAGAYNQYQSIGDIQSKVGDVVGGLQTQIPELSQFKPYTVTTGLGSVTTTPEGGYTTALSPEQQALQNQLMSQATGLFSQAAQGIEPRTQALYDQMRSVMMPEEQRQQLALEDRLAAQGRLGVQTAQYGGTPEQLAMAKAQEEAKNMAFLNAMTQAQNEQTQQANLGQGMLSSAYVPQNQLLSAFTPSANLASLATTAGTNTAGLLAELGLGGLTAEANLQNAQNKILSQAIGTLGASTGGLANIDTGNQTTNQVLDWLFGQIGGAVNQSAQTPPITPNP